MASLSRGAAGRGQRLHKLVLFQLVSLSILALSCFLVLFPERATTSDVPTDAGSTSAPGSSDQNPTNPPSHNKPKDVSQWAGETADGGLYDSFSASVNYLQQAAVRGNFVLGSTAECALPSGQFRTSV